MFLETLKHHFTKIGAYVSFKDNRVRNRYKYFSRGYRQNPVKFRRPPVLPNDITIDVRKIGRKEVFILDTYDNNNLEVKIINTNKDIQHLLLMVIDVSMKRTDTSGKPRITKFLCGHDEKHWFVASIPESAYATNVKDALHALKPQEVIRAQKKVKCKKKNRNKRKNNGYIRQGEWFFVPADVCIDKNTIIHKNEPLSRGRGSKPHIVQELFRKNGIDVHVHNNYAPNGITETTYKEFQKEHPEYFKRKSEWRKMVRDAEAYCRGYVRHPDHKTIHLKGWHRVYMNTENKSWAQRLVVFLD